MKKHVHRNFKYYIIFYGQRRGKKINSILTFRRLSKFFPVLKLLPDMSVRAKEFFEFEKSD